MRKISGINKDRGGRAPARRLAPLLLFAVLLMLAAAVSCTGGEDPSGRPDGNTPLPATDAPGPSDAAETSAPTDDPGSEPKDPYEGKVRPSFPGGFYTDVFNLELTAPEGYSEIRYTLDGTPPDAGSELYTGPIIMRRTHRLNAGPIVKSINEVLSYPVPSARMPGCTVVRAIALDAEGRRTEMTTESYFIWPDGVEMYSCPVISLSLDAGDFAGRSGIYYTTMQHPFETKPRAPAYFEIYDENGVLRGSQWVQISLSGNGSLGNQQKSIRLYFKDEVEGMDSELKDNPGKLKYDVFLGEAKDSSGEPIKTFKRLLLRNAGNEAVGSFMSDRVSQKVASVLNVDYQEARTVVVMINGELWGTYNLRERYCTKYFEAHYGMLEENLGMLEAPTPLRTGNANSPYELTDGDEQDVADWEALVGLITKKDMSKDANYAAAEAQMDMLSLADCMITHMYLCNGDFPWNNVKVWRCKSPDDPSGLDQRWRFVIMDLDGGLVSDYNSNMFSHALNNGTILGSVTVALLNNSTFRQLFIDRCIYVANEVFTQERINAEIDRVVAEMEPAISANVSRWGVAGFSAENWRNRVSYMRTFAANRRNVWMQQLYAYFGITPDTVRIQLDENAATLRLDGSAAKNGMEIDLGNSGNTKELKYEIQPKKGYTLDRIAVVYGGAKKEEILTAASGTLRISGGADVIVSMKKDGAEHTGSAKLAAGADTVYYLTENGELYVWGGNSSGQAGLTSAVCSVPNLVLTGVADVWTAQGGSTGGINFTYILMDDGRLLSAGSNSNGQLCRNGGTGYFAEVSIPGNGKVADVSLGYDHALLLTDDGTLYGVGNNSYCQLGDTGAQSHSTWVRIAGNVREIAAGRRHTLYVTSNGDLYALGDNRWNKLSSAAPEKITSPYRLATGVRAAFCGEHSALYIDDNDVLYYLGTRAGNLQGGVTGKANRVMDGVRTVSMQEGHALIETTGGELYAWGENNYGQTRKNSTAMQTSPVLVSRDVICSGAGAGFSVYLRKDGSVVVMGRNDSGQCGKGAISEKISEAVLSIG